MAPVGPRVSTTSSVRLAGQQPAADVLLGVARAGAAARSSSLSFTRSAPAAISTHVAPGGPASSRKDGRMLGSKLTNTLASRRLPDEVERRRRGPGCRAAPSEPTCMPARRAGAAGAAGPSTRSKSYVAAPRRVEVGGRRARRAAGDDRALGEGHVAVARRGPAPGRRSASSPSSVTSVVGTSSRASPTATLSGEPPTASWRWPPPDGDDDVDERLADDDERGSARPRRLSARSRRRRRP